MLDNLSENISKAAFFKQYAFAASEEALERIWQAKKSIAKVLDLGSEQISDLSSLTHLTALKELSLRKTRVSDLRPLTHLTGLKELHIADTQVSDLSPLTRLTALQMLWAYNTQVSDLSPLTHVTDLRILDVLNTQVSDLSPLKEIIEKSIEVKLGSWSSSNGIFVKDTPLSNPPIEIAKQGNAAILQYWKEQERTGTIRLNEARLLIVGQGGSGKTTLRKKLMNIHADLPADKDITRGIEIEVLSFPNRRLGDKNTEGVSHESGKEQFGLHIWDFGGQNIQHYAHQFFLSDAVVYALVHSEREQNEHSSYWLSIIELLGKKSPVLIVQNEKYGHSEDLKNLASIRERFPNVHKPIKVDLSKAAQVGYTPFSDLQAEIQHLACHLPHIGKEFPVSLNAVRNALQTLAETQNSISWQAFEDLCTKQGIKADDELIKIYARYFHQLGISLWFEEDLDLSEYVFLRPKWIIDALFELLYDGETLRTQALISVKDVKAIWRDKVYKGMHGNLLRLMKNFEMCYEVSTDPPQYIVPQLLPADRTAHQAEASATKVVFAYKFLPKGFLTRLTCRLHARIKEQNVWNDAVQFEDKVGATVFAKETYAQNAIELIAEGTGKRQLLNEVINTLTDINTHSKFNNLQVKILVACPCNTCQRAAEPYQFDYADLKRKLGKGRIKAECQKSDDEVLIKDILREVTPFTFQQIRDYIRNGKAEVALRLLLGRYDKRHDVILLCTQLSQITNEHIGGEHTVESKRVAYNQLTEKILVLLERLQEEEV